MNGARVRIAAIGGVIASAMLLGAGPGLAPPAAADPGDGSVDADHRPAKPTHDARDSAPRRHDATGKPGDGAKRADGDESSTGTPRGGRKTPGPRRGDSIGRANPDGDEVPDPQGPAGTKNPNPDKGPGPGGVYPGDGAPGEGGPAAGTGDDTPPSERTGCDRPDDGSASTGHQSGCGPVGFWADLLGWLDRGDVAPVGGGGGGPVLIDPQLPQFPQAPQVPQAPQFPWSASPPAGESAVEEATEAAAAANPAAAAAPGGLGASLLLPAIVPPPLLPPISLPPSPQQLPAVPVTPAALPADTPVMMRPSADRPADAAPGFVPEGFRAGYPKYLQSAPIDEVAGLALAGVTGLAVLTAAGGLIGYRQAKAGLAVRSGGQARFLQ